MKEERVVRSKKNEGRQDRDERNNEREEARCNNEREEARCLWSDQSIHDEESEREMKPTKLPTPFLLGSRVIANPTKMGHKQPNQLNEQANHRPCLPYLTLLCCGPLWSGYSTKTFRDSWRLPIQFTGTPYN